MINRILALALPPILGIIFIFIATSFDIRLYKNPDRKSMVATEFPENPTDQQLWKLYMKQNLFEFSMFLLGFYSCYFLVRLW